MQHVCNLRFADDLLVIATSKRQLTRMLKELEEAVEDVGLILHAGKTKILTNTLDEHRKGEQCVMVKGSGSGGIAACRVNDVPRMCPEFRRYPGKNIAQSSEQGMG